MLRLAFDFIITWRETRTRPNAYSENGKLVFGKYESYEKVYSLVFRHIGKVTDLAGINRKVSY